jgi:hypothetical protein
MFEKRVKQSPFVSLMLFAWRACRLEAGVAPTGSSLPIWKTKPVLNIWMELTVTEGGREEGEGEERGQFRDLWAQLSHPSSRGKKKKQLEYTQNSHETRWCGVFYIMNEIQVTQITHVHTVLLYINTIHIIIHTMCNVFYKKKTIITYNHFFPAIVWCRQIKG